jgi:2-keto-3-deoxy-L-rhamnonate aldolase RhmA
MEALMAVFENKTLRKLRNGEAALGFSIRHLHGAVPSLMARAAGFDWLFIDTEHSKTTIQEAAETAAAALSTGVTPIVRVCKGQYADASRLLDNGAMGIVMPHITSAAEAREMVNTLRYPPLGHRGWAGIQPSFGLMPKPTLEMEAVLNKEIMLVAMIESPEGIAEAEAIAEIEGIDVLLIGCSDLTIEMGISGQLEHPQLQEAFASVGKACAKHGKTMGVAGVESEAIAKKYIEAGARFALVCSDHALLLNGTRERTRKLREMLGETPPKTA